MPQSSVDRGKLRVESLREDISEGENIGLLEEEELEEKKKENPSLIDRHL